MNPNDVWPNDENTETEDAEYSTTERCGDVDRDEVAHLLVEEDEREELSGFLSW
tara:strand:+ start:1290 stop:1451 length:162 start_codon:yes stop_codon:yes gene_type:complete